MARDHARLFTRIWSDPAWRKLTAAQQRAYTQVLSDPSLTYCGVTSVTMKRWALQSVDTPERLLRKAFDGLAEARWLVFDWDTEEVLVRSFIRNDKVLCVPNVAKSAYAAYQAVLSPVIRAEVLVEVHRIRKGHPEAYRDPAIAAVEPWFTEPLPEGLPEPLPEGLAQGLDQWLPEGLR